MNNWIWNWNWTIESFLAYLEVALGLSMINASLEMCRLFELVSAIVIA